MLILPPLKIQADAENTSSNANGSLRTIPKRKTPDDHVAGAAGVKRKPQETLLKKPAAAAARSATGASRPATMGAKAGAKAAAKVSAPVVSTAGGVTKRPAWDLKGRVDDLANENARMRENLSATTSTVEQITRLLAEKNQSVSELNESKALAVGMITMQKKN